MNFQRPGTAYGSAAFAQAAMNSTSSSFYSKGAIKPAMPLDAASVSTSAESGKKTNKGASA